MTKCHGLPGHSFHDIKLGLITTHYCFPLLKDPFYELFVWNIGLLMYWLSVKDGFFRAIHRHLSHRGGIRTQFKPWICQAISDLLPSTTKKKTPLAVAQSSGRNQSWSSRKLFYARNLETSHVMWVLCPPLHSLPRFTSISLISLFDLPPRMSTVIATRSGSFGSFPSPILLSHKKQ